MIRSELGVKTESREWWIRRKNIPYTTKCL